MVRYSLLPFRLLCHEFGTAICTTPMIIASSLVNCKDKSAFDALFMTSEGDSPLVCQLAANDPLVFAQGCELAADFCQSIDLNCGCPQRWVLKEGIGAALMEKPDLVAEMIKSAKKALPHKSISVKIRIRSSIAKTIAFVQQMEAAGISYLTVHGRSVKERHSPIHVDYIQQVKAVAQVPVVGNGDVFSLTDAEKMIEETKVDGAMAARGLLNNPALFSGAATTPLPAAIRYLQLAIQFGGPFQPMRNHLLYMLQSHLSKPERVEFAELRSVAAVCDFFQERGWTVVN